jgi:apolipoprotein N-acyltransferase
MPSTPGYKLQTGLAVASGLLLTAAFPNVELDWLAWVAMVPLLLAVATAGTRRSFTLGFIAGLTHFLSLVYWVAYTMVTFGGLNWPVSVSILFLMAGFLALYPAVFAVTASRLQHPGPATLVAIPAVWVATEYLRGIVFTGFPWELVGYSQYRALPIIQISDILGPYGVSYLVVFVNTAVAFLLLCLRRQRWQTDPVSGRLAVGSILAAVLLVGLCVAYGGWRMTDVDRLAAAAPTLRGSAVQGNIEQSLKWDSRFQTATVDKYIRLTRTALKQQPQLVVWPETALPFYLFYQKALTERVLQGIAGSQAGFLVGSPAVERTAAGADFFNRAYLLGPDGRRLGHYDKSHLVPFGEYVPLKRWLPFLGKVVAQVGDFRPGTVGDTVDWNGTRLGVLICYEVIFPYISRAATKNGARLLVNITNDAWYGRSSAPYQHFSMAVFRAVENRRALIRAANTGISGFIDPSGRILAATPLFVEAVVTRDVPLLAQRSVYSRSGDVFALACLAAAVLAMAVTEFQRRRTGGRK